MASTTARLHPNGLQRRPQPLSFPGKIDLKVWTTTSTQNFTQDRSHQKTEIRRTRRGEKMVGNTARVHWSGGAPSSEPSSGE
ncbi:hypothetical protein ACLB2K_031065 [Fragaria x ananassa]